MEFIVSRNTLLRALQHVRCAITKSEKRMKTVGLSQTLKALSTEKLTFLFGDSSRAVLIQPQPQPDNEEITMLLMPMICND